MDFAAIVVLEILYMIAFLALISAGLAIVFGMMRVINLAHGEFVMLGGYATIAAAKHGINIYFAMLVISPVVVGIIGLIVERLIVRFLYGRMIDVMLATWGLSLLLVGLVTLIFGNTAVSVPAPIPGYRIGHYQMGGYNLFVIVVAALLMCAMWLALRYTRVGLVARGTMQGAEVVAALGYNPSTVYMLTFTVGAALSGLAGGVMAFITVITGGAAVIAGTLSTATLFGTVDQIVSFASTPVLGEIAMLALALVLLRLMPQGVTGQFFRNST
jgi:urea transport system permease protein